MFWIFDLELICPTEDFIRHNAYIKNNFVWFWDKILVKLTKVCGETNLTRE